MATQASYIYVCHIYPLPPTYIYLPSADILYTLPPGYYISQDIYICSVCHLTPSLAYSCNLFFCPTLLVLLVLFKPLIPYLSCVPVPPLYVFSPPPPSLDSTPYPTTGSLIGSSIPLCLHEFLIKTFVYAPPLVILYHLCSSPPPPLTQSHIDISHHPLAYSCNLFFCPIWPC